MEATEKDELYHHGILGMKWGVRRYQNKDGSLTNAGKKRYVDEEEDSSKSTTKKSVSEMTTTELQAYKQRLQLEKDVFDLQKKVNELNPPKENTVKKMLSTMGPKLAEKVWNDVGKQALNKYLENKLKVEKPLTELDKLKEEAEKWKQKASIAKDQKNYRDDVEKYERGKERYEKERADEKLRNKRMSDLEKMAYAEDKERSKQTKSDDKARNRAQKDVDEYNKSWWKSDSVKPTGDSEHVDKNNSRHQTKTLSIEDKTIERFVATGDDIIGTGTNSSTRWTTKDYDHYSNVGKSYTENSEGLSRLMSIPVNMSEDKSGR